MHVKKSPIHAALYHIKQRKFQLQYQVGKHLSFPQTILSWKKRRSLSKVETESTKVEAVDDIDSKDVVVDIDAEDHNNPFCCAEYAEEIYRL